MANDGHRVERTPPFGHADVIVNAGDRRAGVVLTDPFSDDS